MTIKAIETKYNGYRFRSRTEARWAVFFDALGVKYDYEPEGFELPGGGRYLPDFFVHLRDRAATPFPGGGYWVEIKPILPTEREIEALRHVVMGTMHHGIILAGTPGDQKILTIANSTGLLRRSRSDIEYSQIQECAPEAVVYSPNRFTDAIRASKSARFEFGESGAR